MNKQVFKSKYILVDNNQFSKDVKTLIDDYCSTEDLLKIDKREFIEPIFKSSEGLDASMLSYSSITTSVFKYNDEKKENKLEDIGVFLREALKEHYDKTVVESEVSKDYQERYMVIKKFIEHMDLAINQKENLYIEQRTQINELNEELDKAKIISKTTSKKIDSQLSGIYTQFVAILGIFTSIIFAVFGGFNQISAVGNNLKDTDITKLLIFLPMVMLGIIFLVFISFNAISKLTSLPLSSCKCDDKKKCDCQFHEKHPSIFYSGILFFYIMCIGALIRIYSIKDPKITLSSMFNEINGDDAIPTILLSVLIILAIIMLTRYLLNGRVKKPKDNIATKDIVIVARKDLYTFTIINISISILFFLIVLMVIRR